MTRLKSQIGEEVTPEEVVRNAARALLGKSIRELEESSNERLVHLTLVQDCLAGRQNHLRDLPEYPLGVLLLLAEITVAVMNSLSRLPLLRADVPGGLVSMSSSDTLACLIVFLSRLTEAKAPPVSQQQEGGQSIVVSVPCDQRINMSDFDSLETVVYSFTEDTANLAFKVV